MQSTAARMKHRLVYRTEATRCSRGQASRVEIDELGSPCARSLKQLVRQDLDLCLAFLRSRKDSNLFRERTDAKQWFE
jgi:hypothetical protein